MNPTVAIQRYHSLGGTYADIRVPESLRVNTLATDEDLLVERLRQRGVRLKRVPFLLQGYLVEKTPFSLGSTEEYLLGYYYLQGIASQLPAIVLNPHQGQHVLDLCASPGSKTTQLAQLMGNTGAIVAVEKKKDRLARLTNNLERMRVNNTMVYHLDGRKATTLKLSFDAVLLDAPCSGNYAQEPNWFAKRSLDDIKRNAVMQRRLLEQAYRVLKPGGRLVYSTCSLEPEENELVIDWFVRTFPMQMRPITISLGTPGVTTVFGRTLHRSVALSRRLWPAETKTEGFFIALLEKP